MLKFWIRQSHRGLSRAFTVALAKLIAMELAELPA